jgi:hypothetical protein
MTGSDLAWVFEFSYSMINRNLQDLSQADTLLQPDNGGNCINWVLGHIVVARNGILVLAGAAPVGSGYDLKIYHRGSSPEGTDKFLDFATLRILFDEAHQVLMPVLKSISEDALNSPVPESMRRPPLTGSVSDALLRLQYHEGYHNGQIGVLRRMAGKPGAIS